jgi:predicted lipoprotein
MVNNLTNAVNPSLSWFIIKQNVHLINDTNEWINIASFNNEIEAREVYKKFKAKFSGLVLVKVSEELLT